MINIDWVFKNPGWVFDNVFAPIVLAAIVYFSVRYMWGNWKDNRFAGSMALGAAALAWLISWSTWWGDIWSFFLGDHFFMTMGILISLSLLGIAAYIRSNQQRDAEQA